MEGGIRETLIAIYGAPSVAAAQQSPEFRALTDRYADDPPFKTLELEVASARRELASLLDRQTTQRARVKLALRLLQQWRHDAEKFTLFESLLRGAYYPDWNGAQRAHFDRACELIRGESHYFLSFTHRKPPNVGHEAPNVINDQYWLFITTVSYDRDPREFAFADNLVSAAVDRLLRAKGLSGFYYPHHEGDNHVVREKLQQASRGSVCFVQLVQGVMFTRDEDNYCRVEYDLAREDPERKVLFVLLDARETLQRTRPATALNQPWFDRVMEQDALGLQPTDDYDDGAVRANKRLIKDKIAAPILAEVAALFDRVPAD